ncbi:hypothetical protein MTP02_32210 [Streptomyces albus]|nr:hypothetical protein MTP02_32210 [Streptomyces albus]
MERADTDTHNRPTPADRHAPTAAELPCPAHAETGPGTPAPQKGSVGGGRGIPGGAREKE